MSSTLYIMSETPPRLAIKGESTVMTTTSTIDIHRRPAVVQPTLRYRILIDGVVVARLALVKHHVATVNSGRHSIQVKVLWMSSAPLVVDVAPGETLNVDVSPDAKHLWKEFSRAATFLHAELATQK